MNRFFLTGWLVAGLSLFSIHGWAQPASVTDLDWREGEVPAPPAFQSNRLVRFEVSVGSELQYGLVPDSLSVGPDGVIRFVWVAQSRSGAVNVAYEGVRCRTREMRTYARWSPRDMPLPAPFTEAEGEWRPMPESDWMALTGSPQARPAWMLARAALCEGSTINRSASQMLRDLRQGRRLE